MEWITENWITILLGIAIGLHIYWILSRHARMGHGSHGHAAAPPKDSEEKANGKPTSTGGACH